MSYINTFFYAFGGKIPLLFLAVVLLNLLLLSSMIKKGFWRIVFSIATSLYIVLETVSLFFTQHFISYSFFVHFNLRGVQGEAWMFVPHFIFATLVWVGLIILFFYSNRVTRIISKKTKNISLLLGLLFMIILMRNSTYVSDKKVLFSTLFTKENKAFLPALSSLGMENYTLPNHIQATKGNNIIILSIESLELGFLSEEYAHLTPHLNKLKKSWNFLEIEPTLGCGWTSASLYTSLTGFPAYFGIGGANLFSNVYDTKISSITHALKKAGYHIAFISGDTDHAGTIDMLKTFEFNEVLDYKNTKTTGFESNYGLRDKEIMELAQAKVLNFHEDEKLFALYVSTIDTHFPNGIYDQRFEEILPPQKSEIEFMVSVIDYLIGNFIQELEKLGLLSNTSVFIFPDHLKMGDPKLFEYTGKRKLYLISNSNINQQKEKYYQIDLPKLILSGASVSHNLRFLTDYIDAPVNEFIYENIANITTVNTSGIQKVDAQVIHPTRTSYFNKYISDTARFIAHAGGIINGKIYTNSLDALNNSYKDGFRLMELDLTHTTDGAIIAVHDWEHWRVMTGQKHSSNPVSLVSFLERKLYDSLKPLDISLINKWFSKHKDAILVTDKFESPTQLSSQFIDKNRLMMEMNNLDSIEVAIELGIFGIMMGEALINNMHPKKIVKLHQKGVAYAVVSRTFIHEFPQKTKFMKDLGIKIYIHDPDYENGISLKYMVNYELDYVYGVYADQWIGK